MLLRDFKPPLAVHTGSFLAASPQLHIEPVLHMSSTSEDDMGNSGIAPFEEDVLMVDGPVLDYINEMLMEEGMEDRTCMQRDCITYQAIVNGFYQIIGEHSPDQDLTASSFSQPHKLLVGDDEYSWIDKVLNSNPSSPPPASSISSHSGFRQPELKLAEGDHVLKPASAEEPLEAPLLQMKGIHIVAHGDADPASSAQSDLSFVKNEDLNLEADYANLYVGEWSPRSFTRDKVKQKGKGNNSNGSAALGLMDVQELLVSCAQAVAGGDLRNANEILQELRQHGVSPNGSGLQRVVYHFSEALVARMCGTGGHLYTVASNNRPSDAKTLQAFKMSFGMCPYIKISHYFANQSILKVAEGASRLHIVDYGILYGIQWPYLINALADRKGGPPLLVMTGIDFPQPGLNPANRVEDTGRRLAEYARTYKVPFEYHAIAASKWEDVEPASLHLRQGEALVVNCVCRLRHLPDEIVLASSPRQKVLNRMRSLNPNLLVTAVVNAGCNAVFFVSRFREALYYYSSKFDALDAAWDDIPERMIVERDKWAREILNIVACEGVERVERPETYKQWQDRIQRAGFELPIIPSIMSRSRSHVKNHYHKDFNVHDDSNRWMLLGWKGRTTIAISAWKPKAL